MRKLLPVVVVSLIAALLATGVALAGWPGSGKKYPASTACTSFSTIGTYTVNSDGGGLANYSFRQSLAITNAVVRTRIRVSIAGSSALTSTVKNWSVGAQQSGATTVSTPAELLISGAHGFTLGVNGTTVSDSTVFALAGTETTLIVVFDLNNGNYRYNNSSADTLYYKPASTSYNSSFVGGYFSVNNNAAFVTKIEAC